MKTRILFLFYTILLPFTLVAANLDSLLAILPQLKDTHEVNALNELSIGYIFDDVDKGREFASRAQQKAQQINFKKGEAKALIRLGIAHDISAKFDSALVCYDQALKLYVLINDAKGMASCYNNKAMIYSNQSNYQKAIELYVFALKQFENLNDKLGQGNALNNISVLYNDLNKQQLALKYARQALSVFASIKDEKGIGAAYTNIALSYDDINKDSVIFYLLKAISIKEKMNDNYGLGISYNDLALKYGELKLYNQSFYYFNKAYQIKKEFEDEFGQASILINMSSVYGQQNNVNAQLNYLLQAYAIAQKLNNIRLLHRSTASLSEAYRKRKDWEKAYSFLGISNTYRDTVLNEDNQKLVAEIEAKYQTEKKDLIIANNELELLSSAVKIKQSKTQITLLVVALITLVMGVGLIWIIIRERQKNAKVQQRIAQEKEQNQAVLAAEDLERKRIAKDLHDSAGQQLAAVKLSLSALSQTNPSLTKIITQLDNAIKEVRTISHSMMPVALLNNDLESAISELANQVNASSKIRVETHFTSIPGNLPPVTQSNLYRVVQEGVSNVLKHAQATMLTLQLIAHDNQLVIMIEDNGIGFNAEKAATGLGIQNIKSRVSMRNGEVHFDSGNGTTITIEIPLYT